MKQQHPWGRRSKGQMTTQDTFPAGDVPSFWLRATFLSLHTEVFRGLGRLCPASSSPEKALVGAMAFCGPALSAARARIATEMKGVDAPFKSIATSDRTVAS